MTELDEIALVTRALNGDEEAFGDLVDAYGRVIYNLALRMVGDPEDARDLSQIAFVKAWEKLSTFDRQHRFFSWLYRIALNECLNFRKRRRVHEPLDVAMPSHQAGPEASYERSEESERVQVAMMRLRAEDREVLVLRHFLRLSHREMSEMMHVPEKTVKSRLHTARVRLEGQLRAQGVEAP
ncbi:MAG TPA: sigma-70 family RNA polymerase sigma factor [Candidatus Sulfotelmatobacter sp.]|nr:sigma-70 family RNA polymerase sigma factor [Candidatus Sulfotelmatobacter sp.]